MNRMQKQVIEFHRAMRQSVGDTIAFRDAALRMNLVSEEFLELNNAVQQKNIVATIDAICDLLYVTFGTAVAFGVDIEPFFDKVHQANMLKAGGPIREDGKRLKPQDWSPADIDHMLEQGIGVQNE